MNFTETTLSWNETLMVKETMLYISSVTLQDYGSYNCIGINRYSRSLAQLSLMVLDAVAITSHNLENATETHMHGSRMHKECVASGYPKTITFQWTLGGNPARPSLVTNRIVEETEFFVRVQSVLTIPFVRREDAGVLKCYVFNSLGNDTAQTSINVMYPPELTGHPNTIEYVNLDATLTLSCVATANEHATISWYKRHLHISNSRDIHVIEKPPQLISTLKIYPVTMEMETTYTCVANNSLGKTNFTTSVEVLFPAVIVSSPPSTMYVNNTFTNLTLHCRATGNPRPIIAWYHRGTMVTSDDDGSYNIMSSAGWRESSSTLVIKEVVMSEHGQWSCRATNIIVNGEHMKDEKSFRLVVTFAATFASFFPPPQFHVNETYSILLRCLVKSSPKPTVHWSLPNHVPSQRHRSETKIVREGEDFSVVEENLLLTGVERTDAGTYTCIANNSFITTKKECALQVFYHPSPNFNHTLNLISDQQLTITSHVTSNPVADIQLMINGTNVTNSDFTNVTVSHVNVSDYGVTLAVRLSLRNVTREDSGVYGIKACNRIGCKVDAWDVFIKYQPVLLHSSPGSYVNASLNVTLECTFQMYPLTTPLVTWYHGNLDVTMQQQQQQHKYQTRHAVVWSGKYHHVVTSSLLMRNLTYLDSSSVVCSADNGVGGGGRNRTFDLFISYGPVVKEARLSAQTIDVHGNESFHISFTLLSNPPASFTWYKNNRPISFSQNYVTSSSQPFKYTQTAHLFHLNATKSMSGTYHVSGCNQLGCVESHQIHVLVSFKPIYQLLDIPITVESSSVTLTCKVEGQPSPTVSWWFQGPKLMVNSSSVVISQHAELHKYCTIITSTLTIKSTRRERDSGVYTCVAGNVMGSVHRNASLVFRYSPVSVEQFNNITVKQQQFFTLNYTAHSNPKSSIAWFRNGSPLGNHYTISRVISQSELSTYVQSVLHVPGEYVTGEWSGVYDVIVGNKMGNMTYSANVVVEFAPVLTSTHDGKETIIHKGGKASLLVNVVSNPPSNLQWYRYNTVLTNSSNNNILLHHHVVESNQFRTRVNSTISFVDVDKEDSGYYKCVAINEIGRTTLRIHVVVYYPPIIKPDYPPNAFNVTEFTLPKLCCHVESNPVSTTLWFIAQDGAQHFSPVTGDIAITYNNNNNNNNNNNDDDDNDNNNDDDNNNNNSSSSNNINNNMYEVAYESSLLFRPRNIERTDYGRYYCKATNLLGSTKSFTEVNVQWRPEVSLSKHIIGEIQAFQGVTVVYKCRVKSNPIARLDWLKDSVTISNSDVITTIKSRDKRESIMESLFMLVNVSITDSGNYTCRATNVIGVATQRNTLNVYHAPITLTSNTNHTLSFNQSVLLHCEANGYPPPTFKWYKDGVLLKHTSNIYTATYSLKLERQLRHVYTCVPENEAGHGRQVTHTVWIRAIAFVTNPATCNFTVNLTRCHCNGVSNFPVSVYWTKHGASVVLSRSPHLNVAAVERNDGTYICHLRNNVGEVTSLVAVARFASQFYAWRSWSSCTTNKTCGRGYRTRTRACAILPCRVTSLREGGACTRPCGHGIPVIERGEEEDGYIAIYVLVPISLVLVSLVCLWIVRANVPFDEREVIIPVNEQTLHPPTRPQNLFVGERGCGGYLSKGVVKEGVEVSLVFENEKNQVVEDTPTHRPLPEGGKGKPPPDLPDIFTIMGISNKNYDASA